MAASNAPGPAAPAAAPRFARPPDQRRALPRLVPARRHSAAAARVHGRRRPRRSRSRRCRARSTRPRRSRSRRDLANSYPDRAPGSAGAIGAASWFLDQLPTQMYGLTTSATTWNAARPGPRQGAARERRRGRARTVVPQVIVVMAHRDDTRQRARRRRQRERHRGADRARPRLRPAAARSAPVSLGTHDRLPLDRRRRLRRARRRPLRRALAVSKAHRRGRSTSTRIAGPGAAEHRDRRRRAPLAERDASSRPRSPASPSRRAAAPDHVGFLGQLIDLAFPFTLYEQGPFVAAGHPGDHAHDRGRPPTPAVRRRSRGTSTAPGSDSSAPRPSSCSARSTSVSSFAPSTEQLRLGRRPRRPGLGDRAPPGRAARAVRGRASSISTPSAAATGSRSRPAAAVAAQPALVLALRRRRFHVFSSARGLAGGPGDAAEPGHAVAGTLAGLARSRRSSSSSLLGWALDAAAAGRPPARSRPRRRSPATRSRCSRCSSSRLLVDGRRTRSRSSSSCRRCTSGSGSRSSGSRARRSASALFALGLVGPALLLVSLGWRYGLGLDAPWYLLELVGVGYVGPGRLRDRARGRRRRLPARGRRRRPLRARTRTRASAARAGPFRELVRSVVARDPRSAPGAARARRRRLQAEVLDGGAGGELALAAAGRARARRPSRPRAIMWDS